MESVDGGSLSHEEACKFVSNEYPDICGPACQPSLCDGNCPLYKEPFEPPPTTAPSSDPNTLSLTDPLYCFPESAQRTQYDGAFDGNYVIEVKDGLGVVCGPGGNHFTKDTVQYDASTKELTLEYKMVNGLWSAAEVRILRTPIIFSERGITFSYGSFSFNVKSVSVLDDQDNILSSSLPADIVLGMFTWDTKEDYAMNENWNHEVDIEISQWGDPSNEDVQFLIQPFDKPGPHFTDRFNSGGQGGQDYKFTWNPNEINWSTTAGGVVGTTRTYSTTIAREACAVDYIQCLPSNTEVRINLWNMGDLVPDGLPLDGSQRVAVVIGDFKYEESAQTH
eukprot:11964623-Ditylum_brightwellii.AAC.1